VLYGACRSANDSDRQRLAPKTDESPSSLSLSQRPPSLVLHQDNLTFTAYSSLSLLIMMHTHQHRTQVTRCRSRASHSSADQPQPARAPLEAVARQPLGVVDVNRLLSLLLLLLLLLLRRGG
jgi:hypothetical protein